ncbi:hypothetical protein QFW85_12550 [Vibrio chagasii]|uniref:hypothetical protein n=1 Tax=Vibrio chagasii TaxID=170679 RepID=UPI003DA895BE
MRERVKPIHFQFNATETAFIKANAQDGESIQRTVKNLLKQLMTKDGQASPVEGNKNDKGNKK